MVGQGEFGNEARWQDVAVEVEIATMFKMISLG